MKKNYRFLVGGLIAVVVVVAAYFVGNGGLFQGKASLGGNVTRAELANILLESMPWGVPVGGQNAGCFKDTIGHKYETAICFWLNAGVVKGYVDGNFKPDNNVNRAEAAKFFVVAYEYAGGDQTALISGSNVSAYADLKENAWYYEWIEKAAALGVLDIKPYKSNRFFPADLLSTARAKYWANKLKAKLVPAMP